MTMLLGWLQLVMVIVAAGILGGAVLSALASGVWLERLETVAPRPRFALLSALALAPVVLGLAALTVAFAPSMLDVLGLVQDHCAHHGGHAFHLCFLHGRPPQLSALLLGAGAVLVVWLTASWSGELSRVQQLRRWARRLTQLARFDADINGWRFESERPLAVTVGFFRPKIYVSERMRELLSASQFEAVLAHEQAHARWLDALVKFVVRLCAQLHFPPVRERLLEAIDLASEQACDEAAAEAVGDRLTVAEAILAVERDFGSDQMPATALGFGAGALEARVRGILDADWTTPNWASLSFIGALALGAVVASYDVLHHAAETSLSLLF
jgi:Zn-dependent protease with chaperone function